MRRRQVLPLVVGAIVAPFAARAARAMPVVGFLHSASPSYYEPFLPSIRDGLAETGYVEGRNLRIDYRWAAGQYERLTGLAAELVAAGVDVIFAAGGTDPARAAKAATASIPIVFTSAADPVQTGLVQSLNRPGGNVTGVSLVASALDAKKTALLHELAPRGAVVAALVNPSYPLAKVQAAEVEQAAARLGLASVVLAAGNEGDIDAAFAAAAERKAGALVVGSDPFFNSRREQFVALAAKHALPVIYPQREYVAAGGLVSYGPDFTDGYRQAAIYVGRILNGAKPAELPVLQPTKFELALNLKTAAALGLDVPPTLLASATELVE